MMKSPLTTCASGHHQKIMYKAHYQSQRNAIIYNPANPISPLQYYIELHKHNTELCYLGQKKSQAQESQFAGRWIRSKNKIINTIARGRWETQMEK